jgi:anti-sigma factor RsiW
MNVTRDVVSDLWPLYASGEATADTRALVEAFLAADPDFARTLRRVVELPSADSPSLPDAEAAALRRTRDLVRGSSWMRGVRLMAVAFTALAFSRILSDTTFTRSPVPFIGNVVCAVITWTVYVLWLKHARRRALGTTK